MNRDDVIRMAREAGAVCMFAPQLEADGEWVFSDGYIERLAHLIASHVAEECAKEFEEKAKYWDDIFSRSMDHSDGSYGSAYMNCAEYLRSLYKPTA